MSPEANALIKTLQWPLWFLVMSVVMGALGRSRMKQRTGDTSNVMRSPFAMLVVGGVCIIFFVILAILSQAFPGVDGHGVPLKEANPWFAVFFFGFAALGLPIVISYYRERHLIGPEELQYRTLTKEGVLWWRGVTKVRYSPSMKWFRLEGSNGEVVRISVALTGLPEFARMALEKIPPESIDAVTRALLTATAAGNPPSMWQ